MTAHRGEPRIVATGLSVRRGGAIVVSGVDLDLGAGDIAVLRGPNGSGKSSILRTMAGFAPPAAGTLSIRPLDAADRPPTAHLGHLDGVKGDLTVAENAAFWELLYGSAGAVDAIAALDLSRLADRRAATLSAGQRRRLAFARILIAQRPIWLLDEPTATLDAAQQGVVCGLIERQAKAGGLVVVATHDPMPLAGAKSFALAAPA